MLNKSIIFDRRLTSASWALACCCESCSLPLFNNSSFSARSLFQESLSKRKIRENQFTELWEFSNLLHVTMNHSQSCDVYKVVMSLRYVADHKNCGLFRLSRTVFCSNHALFTSYGTVTAFNLLL